MLIRLIQVSTWVQGVVRNRDCGTLGQRGVASFELPILRRPNTLKPLMDATNFEQFWWLVIADDTSVMSLQ